MDTFWKKLPEPLAASLLAGGVGRTHLTSIGKQCLAESQSDPQRRDWYARLALDTLMAAWAHDPLNDQAARLLLPFAGPADSPLATMLASIAEKAQTAQTRFGTEMGRVRWLLNKGSNDEGLALLHELSAKAEGHPALLKLCIEAYDATGDEQLLSLAQNQLKNTDFGTMQPLHPYLLANLAFASRDFTTAVEGYAKALESGFLAEAAPRMAESLLRMGNRDEAIAAYAKDTLARPWSINSLLRTTALAGNMDVDTAPPPGRTAILIYSFNNAKELDATLEAVYAAEYRDAFLVVLDNGSTDGAAKVLDKWEQVASARQDLPLTRIDLHVNIGAPAARNWLLFHPLLEQADFAAFLDDDALPPTDWLDRLGAAILRYPEAGAWGCKVVDAPHPAKVQSVDLHIKSIPDAPASVPDVPSALLRTTDLHQETPDFGQFDYMRPCASVTGCCHILRTNDLERIGGFDLRFSPSQFDDMDRDLQCCLAGMTPVYQGHLTVRHMKRTGNLGSSNAKAAAIPRANQMQIDMKYGKAEAQTIRKTSMERVLHHAIRQEQLVREAVIDRA